MRDAEAVVVSVAASAAAAPLNVNATNARESPTRRDDVISHQKAVPHLGVPLLAVAIEEATQETATPLQDRRNNATPTKIVLRIEATATELKSKSERLLRAK